jgi:alpha-beta hydrolase superfamily lysophospholipase
MLGEVTLGRWVEKVPTTFGWDGYLDGYVMPVHWFTALGRWLKSLEKQPPLSFPLTIYTGDRDEVVDERWNLAEYRKLVPNGETIILPGQKHLFITSKESRQGFHNQLSVFLAPLLRVPSPPSNRKRHRCRGSDF